VSAPQRIRVWDLPTRLFHWALAGLVTASWLSGQFGGQPWLAWHFRFGYAILTLLVFRLLWGFAGDRYARFSSFIPSWRAAVAHVRSPRPTAGHNPLGSFSVYALLLVAGVQVMTGLYASDGDFTEGPWANFASEATVKLLSGIHRINRWILLALVAVHLIAIAWNTVTRHDGLVRGMLNGDKEGLNVEPAADNRTIRLRGVVLLALSTALVAYIVTV
jgi:cytochrome b